MPARNNDGYFHQFGGRYVAETLQEPLAELERAFRAAWKRTRYRQTLRALQQQFIGRPTPLYHAKRLTASCGGANIYLKLENLANSGAHKINNALGQALLAKEMGKGRIIAETGAGQHGVATAAVCALLNIPCVVYMGSVDIKRQQPNVLRMRLFGAEVRTVEGGSATLKDAVNAALRDWSASFASTYYLLGSALGPSPYPEIVAALQAVIGDETHRQSARMGFAPDYCIACVGGGSNAIGFFAPWIEKSKPILIGVEAGGVGSKLGEHATRMNRRGVIGIAHGYKSFFLQDEDGQLQPTHSISAGLDYPGIGPQLAALGEAGRVTFVSATDQEALAALQTTAHCEGILAALESSHALAHALKIAPQLTHKQNIIVNVSGGGDKDIFIIAKHVAQDDWKAFLQQEIATLSKPFTAKTDEA